MHGSHVVRGQQANGFQVAMALAGVLWRGDKDRVARLLPRRQGRSRGKRRMRAGATTPAAERLGQRGASTGALRREV